jgi:hypothetical protein
MIDSRRPRKGVLPSHPDPVAKFAKRIGKALEPKRPLRWLEDLAKEVARPTHTPKRRNS